MCGILGIFEIHGDPGRLRKRALKLSRLQRHRGPDWSGLFESPSAILAHERLAIVDMEGGAQPLYSPDGQVVLAVSDTGIGMGGSELEHVFDRFWRGDRARSHVAGVGGGLGLAIARQLVQAHGGRINVQSTVGQGTTFTIDLPQTVPAKSL